MQKIKALLWDIDGVFLDTERLHYEAWKALMKSCGKELSLREYAPMIGRGSDENIHDLCRIKGITENIVAMQNIRREEYRTLRRSGMPVITENVELVKSFRKEYPGLTYATVSSARHEYITENLSVANLRDFFMLSISFEDVPGMLRKPAPDIYLYACKILGVLPNECVAFEDSSNGVAAAHAAGIAVVALPSVLTAGQDFSDAMCVIGPKEERSPSIVLEMIGIKDRVS